MERLFELGRLFDFYGGLLTERQRETVRRYAMDDCSLSEIAELDGVSRQAVRDTLAHAEQQMRAYEQSLHLVSRSARMRAASEALKTFFAGANLTADERARGNRLLTDLTDIWEDEDGV